MGALLEREAEVALLRSRLVVGAPGTTLVLRAPGGLGKTSLIEEAAAFAADHGEVVSATAHALESALSFGVMRQLLTPLVDDAPPGAQRLLRPLLEGRGAADEMELVHAAYLAVTKRAERTRLLLTVDDVQWADRGSLMFLGYLAQRVARHPVTLMCAHRPGEKTVGGPLMGRLMADPTEVVTLAPLSPDACARLVRSHLPQSSSALCAETARLSAGNPLLLKSLIGEVSRIADLTGELPAAGTVAGLTSDSIRRLVMLRLAAVPPDARAFAEAVAILGDGCSLHAAAFLSGLEPAVAALAADQLLALGLVEHHQALRLTHPLVASAIESNLLPADRAERHRAAAWIRADEGAEAEIVAAHLLRGTATGDRRAVAMLCSAARVAFASGATDESVRYLRRALDEPPPPEMRPEILLELAEAETAAGLPEGEGRLTEARRALPPTAHGAAALRRLGDSFFRMGRYDQAATMFDAAADLAGGADPELRERVKASKAAMEFVRPGGRPPSRDALEAPRGTSRFLSVRLALVAVGTCAPHEIAREHALRALGEGAMLRETGTGLDYLVAMACLVWVDALDEAEREIELALEDCRRRGAVLEAAQVHFGRAWVRHTRGQLEAAVDSARTSIEPWAGGWAGQVHVARYWCASSLLELGRVEEAAAVLEESEADAPQPSDLLAVAQLAVARGRLATARGRHLEALEHHRRAADLARTLPYLNNPAVVPWRSELALAAQRAGDPDRHLDALEEEVRLARAFGAPTALGVALRAAALAGPPECAAATLREALAALERSPARLEEARTRTALGAALRRQRQRSEAREELREAIDQAHALGAVRVERQAREELRAAGGRVRDGRAGAAGLTPSETRIAAMAARGLSNPEIAATLMVSRRTVEYHLRGAFAKLGISSREQLGAAMEGRNEP